MIQNQLQYRISKAKLKDLLKTRITTKTKSKTSTAQVVRQHAMESLIEELEADIKAFEALQHHTPNLSALDNLADELIQGRIAAGLTHAALAKHLNLHPQQVQRYEASKYASTSLKRLQEIARVIAQHQARKKPSRAA